MSIDFKIDNQDFKRLNEFRPVGWNTPVIDWDKTGQGVSVSNLPTLFDEHYNNRNNK